MLAPWKKSYDQLSVLKSTHITLPTKVCIVKAMIFPVVMYGCCHIHTWTIRWTIKKTERQRTDALELSYWRRFFRFLCTTRSKQSILKEIIPDAEAETPILWLPAAKHGLRKKLWFWEWLKAGEEENDRGWDWMASLTLWAWIWANSRSWSWRGKSSGLQSTWSQRADMTEQLNWWMLIDT